MKEYRRIVSYMYGYPDGVKDSNVGFVKAEVREGFMNLNICLNRVRLNEPACYDACLVFNRDVSHETYNLLKLGKLVVNKGRANYSDLLDPDNIKGSGYGFYDIRGVGVVSSKASYYTMFSLWEKDYIDPARCVILSDRYRQPELADKPEEDKPDDGSDIPTELPPVHVPEVVPSVEPEVAPIVVPEVLPDSVPEILPVTAPNIINVFNDDNYYDCREITTEELSENYPIERWDNNSFVIHNYETYKHILLGKIKHRQCQETTFIGVPGIYCNKERLMATMFGFNNFKRSHRSDIENPHFGYWYREV